MLANGHRHVKYVRKLMNDGVNEEGGKPLVDGVVLREWCTQFCASLHRTIKGNLKRKLSHGQSQGVVIT